MYFAYVSEIFKKSSIDELKLLDGDLKVIKDHHEVLIVKSEKADLERSVRNINPIFIYNILPVRTSTEMNDGDYLESLYPLAKDSIGNKKSKIMVQCFNINSKRIHSAKDIEVYIGERLEKEGYNVDIEAPQEMEYLIILDMICYSGSMQVKDMFRVHVDPKRFYKNKLQKRVSRAELKLEEALDEFTLDVNESTVLDVGAAPGGWSLVLSRKGAKVIAIDSGELDIERLAKENVKVKRVEILPDKFEDDHILHVKSVFENVINDPAPVSNVDMIAIDINTTPDISIKAISKFLPLLSRNAVLIMTVKCVTKNAPRYIEQARNGLKTNFDIKSMRCLPANRMEVTLYAVRR